MAGSTAAVSTDVGVPAGVMWSVIKRSDTQRHLSRGLMGFWGRLPPTIDQGARLSTRLALFNVVPLWRHHIEVDTVDETRMEIVTTEHGGLARDWTHRYRVSGIDHGSCVYTDEIEVDAGALTPLIVRFATLFCRYRGARLGRLGAIRAGRGSE